MNIQILDIKTWLRYKKKGLGKRIEITEQFYFNFSSDQFDWRGKRGTVIAMLSDDTLTFASDEIKGLCGVQLDEPMPHCDNLALSEGEHERYIVRLRPCEAKKGIWLYPNLFRFL
jgi:hypothetical protein